MSKGSESEAGVAKLWCSSSVWEVLPRYPFCAKQPPADHEPQFGHSWTQAGLQPLLLVSSAIPETSVPFSCQDLERRNTELERCLRLAEQTLSETLCAREKMAQEVTKVAEIMDMKIFELSELRQDLAKLMESN